MSATGNSTPYANLTPDCVLDAVGASGLLDNGRLLMLNSYENRVYQIGLDDGTFVVAKFYRAGRWSDAAIIEEHDFSQELADAELPIVAPLRFHGHSLLLHEGFRYALYPRRGGRAPSLESASQLEWMGRLIARMHGIGARTPFRHRETLSRRVCVTTPADAVLDSALLPDYLHDKYQTAIERIDAGVAERFDSAAPIRHLRLHGDCHPGNILWTDAGPHFVDLDDARSGPAMQDLWMLANDESAMRSLLDGYAQFADLAPAELSLIPALRAMRVVHHAGWIAQRWQDPAFPNAFPYAAEAHWWQEHVEDLDALGRGLS